MERLTNENYKLGFCDSNTLPSYVALYERLQAIENILGKNYELKDIKTAS